MDGILLGSVSNRTDLFLLKHNVMREKLNYNYINISDKKEYRF